MWIVTCSFCEHVYGEGKKHERRCEDEDGILKGDSARETPQEYYDPEKQEYPDVRPRKSCEEKACQIVPYWRSSEIKEQTSWLIHFSSRSS